MTNKEAPKLKKKKIKPNSMVYQFSGGDLWDRYPLSKYNDLGLCLNKIKESAYDYPDESGKSTFDYPDKKDNFEWHLTYYLPDPDQLKKLKNKKIKRYEVKDHNVHIVSPILYNFGKTKDNILWISEDLLVCEESYFIVQLANKLNNLSKIYITQGLLTGGFLDGMSGSDQENYIRKDIKGEKKREGWVNGLMSIIKSHRDPEFGGKYLNELDDLIYIKQNIDPSIKFEFYHLTEKEKKILKREKILIK